jgi:phosphoglycolate phosphatase
MRIDGILFDKDGTLIDFHATWNDSFQRLAESLGGGDRRLAARLLEVAGFDAVRQRFLPGSLGAAANTLEIAEAWLRYLPQERSLDRLAARMDAHFVAHSSRGAVPLTDLGALFGGLQAKGIKIGVATSDSEAGARATLDYFGLGAAVDFIAGYDSGHGVKPGAGMPIAFARTCGIELSAVMVVGDNRHDLEMGRNAGAGLCVGVLSGTGGEADLAGLADHVLDDVAQIPALLRRLAAPSSGS